MPPRLTASTTTARVWARRPTVSFEALEADGTTIVTAIEVQFAPPPQGFEQQQSPNYTSESGRYEISLPAGTRHLIVGSLATKHAWVIEPPK